MRRLKKLELPPLSGPPWLDARRQITSSLFDTTPQRGCRKMRLKYLHYYPWQFNAVLFMARKKRSGGMSGNV